MTAATILLQELQALGVTITVMDGGLRLSGNGARPRALLDRVRGLKAEIVRALDPHGWDVEDWRDYFEERAAVAEYDAKMPRNLAERHARLICRQQWYALNPPLDPGEGRCCHCQHDVYANAHVIFTLRWKRDLHTECERDFSTARMQEADAALSAAGIAAPTADCSDAIDVELDSGIDAGGAT